MGGGKAVLLCSVGACLLRAGERKSESERGVEQRWVGWLVGLVRFGWRFYNVRPCVRTGITSHTHCYTHSPQRKRKANACKGPPVRTFPLLLPTTISAPAASSSAMMKKPMAMTSNDRQTSESTASTAVISGGSGSRRTSRRGSEISTATHRATGSNGGNKGGGRIQRQDGGGGDGGSSQVPTSSSSSGPQHSTAAAGAAGAGGESYYRNNNGDPLSQPGGGAGAAVGGEEDDEWEVMDARPILPKLAFFMGDMRDGLPMINMQATYLMTAKYYTGKQVGILLFFFGVSQFLAMPLSGYLLDYTNNKIQWVQWAAITTSGLTVFTALFAHELGSNLVLMILIKIIQGCASTLLPLGLHSITLGIVGSTGMTSQVARNKVMNHLGTALIVAIGTGAVYLIYPSYSDKIGFLFVVSPVWCMITIYYLWRIKPGQVDRDAARALIIESPTMTEYEELDACTVDGTEEEDDDDDDDDTDDDVDEDMLNEIIGHHHIQGMGGVGGGGSGGGSSPSLPVDSVVAPGDYKTLSGMISSSPRTTGGGQQQQVGGSAAGAAGAAGASTKYIPPSLPTTTNNSSQGGDDSNNNNKAPRNTSSDDNTNNNSSNNNNTSFRKGLMELSKPASFLNRGPSFILGLGMDVMPSCSSSSNVVDEYGIPIRKPLRAQTPLWVLSNPTLLLFTTIVFLFHMGNSAVLPLVMQTLAVEDARKGILMSGLCIFIAQGFMACFAKIAGDYSPTYGRKNIFLFGLFSLPVRCFILFYLSQVLKTVQTEPVLLVVHGMILSTQLLDAVGAGIFGTLYVLVTNDIAAETGRFNLMIGLTSGAMCLGGTVSGYVGQALAQDQGYHAAFAFLGLIGLLPAFLYLFFMPETLPEYVKRKPKNTRLGRKRRIWERLFRRRRRQMNGGGNGGNAFSPPTSPMRAGGGHQQGGGGMSPPVMAGVAGTGRLDLV